MGELESLFLVVTLVYLAECASWIRRNALFFSRFSGKYFQARSPGPVLGNQRGGFCWANPFPPFGSIFLSSPFPVSFSSKGVLSFNSASPSPFGRPPQTARFLSFDDIKTVSIDGRRISVNDVPFVTTHSFGAAASIAALMRALKNRPPEARDADIRAALQETLDTGKIGGRTAEAVGEVRILRRVSVVLFIFLFVLAPISIWYFGLVRCWPYLLGGLLAQTILQATLFFRAHGKLFPKATEARFTPFLVMLLAPPSAIRAHDHLTLHLLESFHPLAVAKILCQPEEFQRLARLFLRDLHFPLLPVCNSAHPDAIEAESDFRKASLAAVEDFLRHHGLVPAELLAPPRREKMELTQFCPRCEAQFLGQATHCADCGGRPLQSF